MSDSTENTSKPSREQLEARVVAMLLGEASPFEEEQLREQLKTDVDLAKFCTEIEKTLPLLNEALDVGQAPKAKSPKQRLDRKRRGKLKLLFRSDTGLAKRRIFRLDFRKGLGHRRRGLRGAVCRCRVAVAQLGQVEGSAPIPRPYPGCSWKLLEQARRSQRVDELSANQTGKVIADSRSQAVVRLLSPTQFFPATVSPRPTGLSMSGTRDVQDRPGFDLARVSLLADSIAGSAERRGRLALNADPVAVSTQGASS